MKLCMKLNILFGCLGYSYCFGLCVAIGSTAVAISISKPICRVVILVTATDEEFYIERYR